MLAVNFSHWEAWELRHKVTFDPSQRLIFVNSGVTSIDVKVDVYSDWKEWARLHENLRFPPAIRAIGGDPTTGGQTAGDIYFLRNNWRLVVDLAHTQITGVLFSDNYDTPLLSMDLDKSYQSVVSSLVTGTQLPVVTGDLGDTNTSIDAVLSLVKYINQAVHVNPDANVNGDGSVRSPFDNIGDALDFAELVMLDKIHIHADVEIDRNLKNFTLVGVGNPNVDFDGQNIDKSEFEGVTMRGSYTGRIVARGCTLADNLSGLDGKFMHCGLGGDLFCADGSDVEMIDPYSGIEGTDRPTITAASASGLKLGVRGMRGGLTIKSVDHALTSVSVEMATGGLTLESTCDDGVIVVRGSCTFIDNNTGSSVDVSGLVSEQVWNGIQI